MINFLRKILKPKYDTLNEIEISREKIIANFNYLKSLQPEAEIFPVLKSNAYGHGLKEVCQILNKTGVAMVVVDSFPEAQIVYRYFKGKVLILGEMPIDVYKYIRLARTEFVIYNSDTLKYISRYGKRARIHLFVNSGMNREGIKNLPAFIEENRRYLERVDVNGLCSHLASADNTESNLNKEQEDCFIADLEILKSAGFSPRFVHLGNSAAIFSLNNKLLTAYRPGLALYGYAPINNINGKETELQAALQIFSHIVSIQDLKKGEAVSYNESYRAENDISIAVIPFGYFEGLDRRLSNQAKFLIEDEAGDFLAPIAGKVCMNLTCLEIKKPVKVGDVVKIISDNNDDPNSVINISKMIGTIPYEFLVKLQANIRRKIV
ncbi:MAG: alanine racemase [Patescibacteria group bacterium]